MMVSKCFEDYFPFGMVYFQGLCLSSGGYWSIGLPLSIFIAPAQPRRLSRNAATIFYEDRLICGPWVVEWGIHEKSAIFLQVDPIMAM